MQIEDLPDYPSLQQLSRALWREGTTRGAAVLVGAGFSKNAERSSADTLEPPLWTDLAESITNHLYPGAMKGASNDPLRLAEEYKAYFGRAALDQLIRTRICDSAWQPGSMHKELLKLEWSDVLTTNWDTLLERASETLNERIYETVRSETDLSHARSPRIVKLHGSIEKSQHFILTEEDYRTYPVNHAAFVNLARQIFIENELCLLGFSGDDPNFLQWSGWVRDNLGGSARRIYLVGVLNLNPARRKLLESRNVAPIDLAPLVSDKQDEDQHEHATYVFLEFLRKSKPKALHEWQPVSTTDYVFLPKTVEDQQRRHRDPSYAASLLDEAAKIWERERKSYPGWLICPARLRSRLQHGVDLCRFNQPTLEMLPNRRQAEILYEISWRRIVSLTSIDDDFAGLLAKFAKPSDPQHLTRRQCLEMCVLLLQFSRQSGDDNAFDHWAETIKGSCELGSDFAAEYAYQRAIRARDMMDFGLMKTELESVQGEDPVWRLRRAALLAEAGDNKAAATLVFEARSDLDGRQRKSLHSLWVRSRRAWAEWLARATKLNQDFSFDGSGWSLEFKTSLCDPGDEVDSITSDTAHKLRKRQEDAFSSIPPFQAGHYRTRPKEPRVKDLIELEPMVTLDLLMETSGVPMKLNHVNLVNTAALNAADLSFNETVRWYVWVIRALNGPWGPLFERYFSRVAIACIPIETINILLGYVCTGIRHWQNAIDTRDGADFTFSCGKMRLLFEILARLMVRQDSNAGTSTLNFILQIVQKPWIDHRWLNESLEHLVHNCIDILTPTDTRTYDSAFTWISAIKGKDSIFGKLAGAIQLRLESETLSKNWGFTLGRSDRCFDQSSYSRFR